MADSVCALAQHGWVVPVARHPSQRRVVASRGRALTHRHWSSISASVGEGPARRSVGLKGDWNCGCPGDHSCSARGPCTMLWCPEPRGAAGRCEWLGSTTRSSAQSKQLPIVLFSALSFSPTRSRSLGNTIAVSCRSSEALRPVNDTGQLVTADCMATDSSTMLRVRPTPPHCQVPSGRSRCGGVGHTCIQWAGRARWRPWPSRANPPCLMPRRCRNHIAGCRQPRGCRRVSNQDSRAGREDIESGCWDPTHLVRVVLLDATPPSGEVWGVRYRCQFVMEAVSASRVKAVCERILRASKVVDEPLPVEAGGWARETSTRRWVAAGTWEGVKDYCTCQSQSTLRGVVHR